MGESSSVSEYKRHEEYFKWHTVYKDNAKLQEYFQRWERNKKVCITLIFHWPYYNRAVMYRIPVKTIQYSTLHYDAQL